MPAGASLDPALAAAQAATPNPGETMQSIAPFAISVCGIEELTGHCETGVSHCCRSSTPTIPNPRPSAASASTPLELRFHDIIEETPGHVATADHAAAILGFGRDLRAEPAAAARLLVHCHAGISRSTAGMALVLAQARPDATAEQILQGILGIRDKAWPNLRLLELGDAMLGRGGTLPAAAAALYCHQLRIRPHLVEIMRKAGRGRKVDAAATAVLPGQSVPEEIYAFGRCRPAAIRSSSPARPTAPAAPPPTGCGRRASPSRCARCTSTVRGLMPRSWAMVLFSLPATSPTSTSRSRGDSAAICRSASASGSSPAGRLARAAATVPRMVPVW